MEQHSENKMGYAPIVPLLLSMSLPAILSMTIQALYNVVDSIYVSRISQEALSAISIANPLQMLMISICVGTAVGVNSLVARRLGEGRRDEACHAATNGLILSFLSWVVVAVVALIVVRPFFAMTTENASIAEMGMIYARIVLIGSVSAFIQVCIEKTLQATGNMILPMCSQLIGCIINIILDPILIFGIKAIGLAPMGISGAAIATIFGQFCGMVFCIAVLLKGKHEISISFKKYKLSKVIVKDIYVVSFPSIIMQAISSILTACLNVLLINFSEAAVNVYGVYFRLQSFVFMPIFGLNQGVMPILGYNYGAGNKERLMKALRTGIGLAAGIMLIGTILFHAIPNLLLGMFNADANMLDIGIPALKTISLCFVPAAFGIMFSTLFQALGKGVHSLLMSLVRQLICILPVAYILSKISLSAVWYAFPIAEGVALIMGLAMTAYCYKTIIKNLRPVREASGMEA